MFNHIMIWGSLLSYFVLDSFYNYVFGAPYVGALAKAITGSTFWLTMILTVIILMTPVLAWRFYSFECHPSLADKIRMKQRQTKQVRSKPEMLRTPSARRSRRSLRSSYAFAHEVRIFFQSFERFMICWSQMSLQEGFGRLITSGKIMRKLPQDFAFPLGLGTKKQHSVEHPTPNGVIKVSSKILPGSSNSDLSPRAPLSDLDTINLWIFVRYLCYLSLLWINCTIIVVKTLETSVPATLNLRYFLKWIRKLGIEIETTTEKIKLNSDRTSKNPIKAFIIHFNANAFENSRIINFIIYEICSKFIRKFDLDEFRVFVILLNLTKTWILTKKNTFICAFLLESC